jgi:toxin YoeB
MPEAVNDITDLKRSDEQAYKKVISLIKELHEHPRIGTGKPKLLRYGKFKGLWSRRITSKHRLVYLIKDYEIVVLILSAQGHYDDK